MIAVPVEVLVVASMAFAMGITKAILIPKRRGLAGFASACVVAVCCGTVAGVISGAFGANAGIQYTLAVMFAVFGDIVIFAMIEKGTRQVVHNTIFNGPVKGDAKVNQGEWTDGDENRSE